MNIKEVQKQLNILGFGYLEVDGINGTKTIEAIKRLQKTYDLEVDGIVGPDTLKYLFPVKQPTSLNLNIRAMEIALTKVGVRELTGQNDGPEVEQYLKAVGLPKGYSWCMAFVVWCYQQAAAQLGLTSPLIPTGGVLKQWQETKGLRIPNPTFNQCQVGDIFIIDLGHGAGHTGIITGADGGDYVQTVEGNTNTNGSANGDGVYERSRMVAKLTGIIRPN